MRSPNLPLLALSAIIAGGLGSIFLAACDSGGSGTLSLRERAADVFSEHPEEDVFFVGSIGDPEAARWVAGTVLVGSEYLVRTLDPCHLPEGLVVTATIRISPGAFPFPVKVDGVHDADATCVAAQLSRLQIAGPVRPEEVQLAFAQIVIDHMRLVAPAGQEGLFVPANLAILPDQREEDIDEVAASGAVFRRPVLPAAPGVLTLGPDGAAAYTLDAAHVRVFDAEEGEVTDPAEGIARRLTCDANDVAITHTTLTFSGGTLDEVETDPEVGCVEKRAWEAADWLTEVDVWGVRLSDTTHATIVLDVPVGVW